MMSGLTETLMGGTLGFRPHGPGHSWVPPLDFDLVIL